MKKMGKYTQQREAALASVCLAMLTATDKALHLFERYVEAHERIAKSSEESTILYSRFVQHRARADEREEQRWQARLRSEDEDRRQAEARDEARMSHDREMLALRADHERMLQQRDHEYASARADRETRAAVTAMFDERERRDRPAEKPWHPPTLQDVARQHPGSVPTEAYAAAAEAGVALGHEPVEADGDSI